MIERKQRMPITITTEEGSPVNYFIEVIERIEETPLDNRLIVLEDDIPAVRKSGIYLTEESKVKPYTGIVIAIGPKVEVLKPEDRVRYASRAGDKITIEDKEYLMLRETDIYTKLK